MTMQLHKVHGSGNTFYILETTDEKSMDWSQLSIWLCQKENLGGADGLLLVAPSKKGLAKMRVINADGSEASMCGNGLRCVARYICEKNNVSEALIETMKAVLKVQKEAPIYAEIPTYSVEIAPISFELTSLPMSYKNKYEIRNEMIAEFADDITFTAVSVPNPHLIGIVQPDKITNTLHQERLSSMLNGQNDFCPDGVNVSYVYPMDAQTIYVRTYERGVGFTNACGTAMTASALVSSIVGVAQEGTVTVFNPGGFVQCHVKNNKGCFDLKLVGNATFIAELELNYEKENEWLWQSVKNTDEQKAYESLIAYTENKIAAIF
ncbi:diaminopimelate epimerase [Viridibacillus sp. YIM B01967]|uniref:Diaminopimelate epimerase n=1 Tax=Viridibacillus soli TaxID=2798301 RepID=A0ABS1HC58_9BACL|nr:diaminopimelate epimerase [Viridibacillus soli]MBK3496844.1 diaminopimelate epimerase [Viridibacillus soli]